MQTFDITKITNKSKISIAVFIISHIQNINTVKSSKANYS